jgi:hypothetical protein
MAFLNCLKSLCIQPQPLRHGDANWHLQETLMRQFFGKYRGKVAGNKDPLHLGRVMVLVPAVFGAGRQTWAMPCVPYAGANVGVFAIPPVNANIWVEFEGGDPDYPIWSGCFWGQDELPQLAKVDDPALVHVIKTGGMTCVLDRTDGTSNLTVQVEQPGTQGVLKLAFNADGIELNNGDRTFLKLTPDEISAKSPRRKWFQLLPFGRG